MHGDHEGSACAIASRRPARACSLDMPKVRALCCIISLVACAKATPEPPPKPAPEAKAEPAPVAPVDPQRWACASDKECTQTCELGAVNRAWITAHPEADSCDDGCGWKPTVACRDAECVTLTEDGQIDAGCTKRAGRLQ
jgi:hypothetical protein